MASGPVLADLISYASENGRVCPVPMRWNELWDMLPGRHRVGSGWEPPAPLILAAWWGTPASSKILRVREHLEYASEEGVLAEVDTFVRSLPETDWAHLGDF